MTDAGMARPAPMDQAWADIGAQIEAEFPGWHLDYGLYGFTATRGGQVLGPAPWCGIRALLGSVPAGQAGQ